MAPTLDVPVLLLRTMAIEIMHEKFQKFLFDLETKITPVILFEI